MSGKGKKQRGPSKIKQIGLFTRDAPFRARISAMGNFNSKARVALMAGIEYAIIGLVMEAVKHAKQQNRQEISPADLRFAQKTLPEGEVLFPGVIPFCPAEKRVPLRHKKAKKVSKDAEQENGVEAKTE